MFGVKKQDKMDTDNKWVMDNKWCFASFGGKIR